MLACLQQPQESNHALVGGTSKKRKKQNTETVEKQESSRKKHKNDGESESKARVGATKGECDETVKPTKAKKRKKEAIAEKEEEATVKNGHLVSSSIPSQAHQARRGRKERARAAAEKKLALSEREAMARRRAAREKRLAFLLRASREKILAILENRQHLESNTPTHIPKTQTRENKQAPENIEIRDKGAGITPNGASLDTSNFVQVI